MFPRTIKYSINKYIIFLYDDFYQTYYVQSYIKIYDIYYEPNR